MKTLFELSSSKGNSLKSSWNVNVHVMIDIRADIVACGNFHNRKDNRICSLISRNDPNFFKKYYSI